MALLDDVLGGLAPALPVVVTGPTGAGRTLLCLQLAASYTARGECTVFLTEEPPALLLRQAASLGLDLEGPVRDGRLVMLELQAEAASNVRAFGAEVLVSAIQAEAPRARLLVIDPVTALTCELIGEGKHRDVVRALFEASAKLGQVTVVTAENDRLRADPALVHALESLCGVLLELDRNALGRRVLRVQKSRLAVRVEGEVEFDIGPCGLVPVDGDGERAASAVTAAASPPAPAAEAPVVSPPASATVATPRPGAAPPRAENRRPRVLVVEDDRVTLEMLCDWLRPRYDVITAEDGFSAVSAVFSQHPDVILLDLVLPRVSGFEVIRTLRAARAAMPILVISGSLSRSGDRVRVLVLGATDMLAKPLQRFELLRKVDTLLQLPPAPEPAVDPEEVDSLLFANQSTRILEEPEFCERLDRACRFGQEFGLASTLVFVRAPSAQVLDALLTAADQSLRLEDAALAIPKRRAVLLLVATEVGGATPALERVGQRLREAGVDTLGLRWRAVSASPEGAPRFEGCFQDLEPWPRGGTR